MSDLAIIVAMGRDRVIGRENRLPWHLSEDLKHFKRTTMGHTVIMGRKTFESIGRPLPKRRNIVVTRQAGASFEGCETAHSLEQAVVVARQQDTLPFVIGGSSLFAEALPATTHLYLTEIDRSYDGDVFFPEFDRGEFDEVERRDGETEGLVFSVLRRK